jgi:hypothetical protein
MKQIVTPLVFLAVSMCSAEKEPKGRTYSSTPLDSHCPSPPVIWVDAKTQQVLFTLNDIIVFDWDHQVFELKLNAALDFRAWMVKGQYRELLVKDNLGTIYRGQWVNPVLSKGFSGPTYHSMGTNRLFLISNGYGGGTPPPRLENGDLRFSDRLYKELKKAGLLGTIASIKTVGDTKILELSETYDHRRIDSINLGWHDCGKGLRIGVEYFADTFRIGEEARAHLFFSADEKSVSWVDDIVFEIKFTANEGQFRSDIRMEGISPSVIADGIYVCRFRPWNPLPGSLTVQRGTGRVALSVLIRRKTEDGYEVIRRLDFPEIDVPVSGAMPGN